MKAFARRRIGHRREPVADDERLTDCPSVTRRTRQLIDRARIVALSTVQSGSR